MSVFVATCRPWQGRPTQFQAEAIAVIVADGNRVGHYAWASSTCGTEMCLHPDHLMALWVGSASALAAPTNITNAR